MFTNFLVFLFFALPNVVDGDIKVAFDRGQRGGDPVLTVNGKPIIHKGSGPGEIELATFGYDPASKTAWVSDSWTTYFVDVASFKTQKKHHDRWTSLRGVWGDFQVVFRHDYLRNRTQGGRLLLESESETLLIASQSAGHSSRQDLTGFVRSRNALVILDNFSRMIGYLPRVEGRITAVKDERLEAVVPKDLVWYPMPHEIRETPHYSKRHQLQKNRYLLEGAEIYDGLFVLADNQGNAFVYDLANQSNYRLGSFTLNDMIAGAENGNLILRDLDNNQLKVINPLELTSN